MKRKVLSITLVFLVLLSRSVVSFAWPKIPKIIDKAVDWTEGAVKDATNWTDGAVEDATDWTEGAVKDATNWTEGAVKDATNWTEGAVEDATNWTEGAVKDATGWVETAYDDVSDYVDDVLKSNPELREIDLLPVLTVDLSTATSVLTADTGAFKYGSNVKDKKLPSSVSDKLKSSLMDLGLSNYWSDFVIRKSSEASGEINPGGYIAGMLPYSEVLYGDKLAELINGAILDATLEDVDPYIDGIVPSDNVDGMDFTYVVDSSKVSLDGSYLVMVTGLEYGRRDDFKVTIKADGQEYPTTKKALNKEEVAFVAEVPSVKSLEVVYKNNFEKPADIAFEVADAIQDSINGLPGVPSPISNSARDEIANALNNYVAFYIEETKTDKDGNVKTDRDGNEEKEYKDVSLNDVLGDGDAGVLITKLIYKIPVVGNALKPIMIITGGDEGLAEIIRDAIGQAEVKSYAKFNKGKIYLKQFSSMEEMATVVENATTEAAVNMYDYVEEVIEEKNINTEPEIEDFDGVFVDNSPQMPMSVQIQYGHTVGNISLQYYGDYSMMDEIYEANKDYFSKTNDRLNTGDTLVLPIPAKVIPPIQDENTRVYIVKLGDTLASIAKEFYGNPKEYNRIAEANNQRIADVDKIYEGQIIAIPLK